MGRNSGTCTPCHQSVSQSLHSNDPSIGYSSTVSDLRLGTIWHKNDLEGKSAKPSRETHNHPTAISPFPGAATGAGGEIRDEGAVGRGSSPKAGLCGFCVSDLNIPESKQPWEIDFGRPGHVASSLEIMLEGPIGAARFNNEFG